MPELNQQPRWCVIECDEPLARDLAHSLDLPEIVGRLLVNRGVKTPQEARGFLQPSLSDLYDPFLLLDMEPAAHRVADALRNHEKIMIHGDYDVDGITSAAILVRSLRALGGDVHWHIPHRRNDGYDIKPHTIDAAARNGTDLVITCDCGTTAIESARRAIELGVGLIITDHHEPGPVLPEALAVVNPKRIDSTYPDRYLAGAGVAFKLAQAVVRKFGAKEESFVAKFLDLATIGTVGDVVPLVGENRTIVKHGLRAIAESKKTGIRSVIRLTGYADREITAYYLSYVLGPRINAVGRMGDAEKCLRLLTTSDEHEAETIVGEMEETNRARREEQKRIFEEAFTLAEAKDLDATSVLVLAGLGWNTGVVGIVAGKLCEAFGRPAIVLNRDALSGMCHGSARSIDSFDLLAGLNGCADLLGRFGGHSLAAGLSLRAEALAEFEKRINSIAHEWIPPEEIEARIEIEAELNADDVSENLACAIAQLEPFGCGNPEPLFASTRQTVVDARRVGNDKSHLKLMIARTNAQPLECIAFGFGEMAEQLSIGTRVDLCYTLQMNEFNGRESVQIKCKDIRMSS